ncbi:NUDIX hydrolase [bacterium]|nr:NUDIX hydrolase [bacterium]
MKKISEKTLFEGKWLVLKAAQMKKGDFYWDWEFIQRKNNRHAVVIIPKLIPSNRYLLIKEYRAAIDSFVIAFPAGLSEGDKIENEALRELEEESGYIGVVKSVSPILNTSPAISSSTFQAVFVEIDENLLENRKPIQKLENSESIEAILIEPEKISDFFSEMRKKGVAISSAVWYFFQKF